MSEEKGNDFLKEYYAFQHRVQHALDTLKQENERLRQENQTLSLELQKIREEFFQSLDSSQEAMTKNYSNLLSMIQRWKRFSVGISLCSQVLSPQSSLWETYLHKKEQIYQEFGLCESSSTSSHSKFKNRTFRDVLEDLKQKLKQKRFQTLNIKDIQTMYQVAYATASKILKTLYEQCRKAFQWHQKEKKGKDSRMTLEVLDVSWIL